MPECPLCHEAPAPNGDHCEDCAQAFAEREAREDAAYGEADARSYENQNYYGRRG